MPTCGCTGPSCCVQPAAAAAMVAAKPAASRLRLQRCCEPSCGCSGCKRGLLQGCSMPAGGCAVGCTRSAAAAADAAAKPIGANGTTIRPAAAIRAIAVANGPARAVLAAADVELWMRRQWLRPERLRMRQRRIQRPRRWRLRRRRLLFEPSPHATPRAQRVRCKSSDEKIGQYAAAATRDRLLPEHRPQQFESHTPELAWHARPSQY